MQIGAFAAACGTSVRMLRFYEDAGILKPVRSAGNYRLYSADDVAYVKKVIMLNQAGLSLKDIAIMRDCLHDRPQDFCPELRQKLRAVQDEIGEKISSLKASKALLAALLDEGGSRRSLAEALASMPNVGRDEDFERQQDGGATINVFD